MSNKIKMIVGLGNPGAEYEQTRHNAGFWFIDELAWQYKATLKEEKKFFNFSSGTLPDDGNESGIFHCFSLLIILCI